jgi:hypothetical protein
MFLLNSRVAWPIASASSSMDHPPGIKEIEEANGNSVGVAPGTSNGRVLKDLS